MTNLYDAKTRLREAVERCDDDEMSPTMRADIKCVLDALDSTRDLIAAFDMLLLVWRNTGDRLKVDVHIAVVSAIRNKLDIEAHTPCNGCVIEVVHGVKVKPEFHSCAEKSGVRSEGS